jgi:hypothetical protein
MRHAHGGSAGPGPIIGLVVWFMTGMEYLFGRRANRDGQTGTDNRLQVSTQVKFLRPCSAETGEREAGVERL